MELAMLIFFLCYLFIIVIFLYESIVIIVINYYAKHYDLSPSIWYHKSWINLLGFETIDAVRFYQH
jgi:hypothetical protein